jgi:lambda family phage portal protein
MLEQKNTIRPAWWASASRLMDGPVGILSPSAALRRAQYRMAYEILDGSGQRKQRTKAAGTGDAILTELRLANLRDISRDLVRNNSIVEGMLNTEANDVVGESGPMIQAATDDKGWNAAAERLWKSTMIDEACDVSGTLNWPAYLWLAYFSYRRDGDFFTLFTDSGLQPIEGERVGTPTGKKTTAMKLVNGIATNDFGRVLGYYIGTPDTWGFIQNQSWKAYPADSVAHILRHRRFSASRGEPALTSALKYLDMLDGYLDAELVAAKVAACFTMFIAKKGYAEDGIGPAFGTAGSGSLDAASGLRQEKLSPGQILYGETDESATSIANNRPGQQFEMFIRTLQSISGRGVCMPLMYVTMDFSGATFMNTRVALQTAQKLWKTEQEHILKPMTHRVWRWWVQQQVAAGRLADHPHSSRIDIYGHRWPYVDPFREAQAERIQLENGTTNRSLLCANRGMNFQEIETSRAAEEQLVAARPQIEEPKP